MASKLENINFALRRLGCEPIASVSEDSKRAEAMVDIYEIARKESLELFNWGFAGKLAELSANATTPAFKWTYYFDLPADYIIARSEYNEYPFDRLGDYLASDSDTLQLDYTYDVTDEAKFSPSFTVAFGLTLAMHGAYSLTQDKKLFGILEKERKGVLEDARYNSSRENSPKNYEARDFLDVRI